MIHPEPICFGCHTPVIHEDPVFSCVNPSDHDHSACPSAVWHGMCLMDFRDNAANVSTMLESSRVEFVASILAMFGIEVNSIEMPDDESE
jgi:hypothetical protein